MRLLPIDSVVLESTPIQIKSTMHGMPILVQCATFLSLMRLTVRL